MIVGGTATVQIFSEYPFDLPNSSIFEVLYPSALFTVIIIAWIILGIQFIYLIRFIVALWKSAPLTAQTTPAISVIVCAHDEEQNLRELVPLLLLQDYPEFEVIIVDDRSNDHTYDYLLQATSEHPRLKMVRVTFLPGHITGKKYALTLGVKAAAHDWVLLTDADCRPAGSQWIRSMAASMTSDKQIVIGYSPYLPKPGWLNSFIRFESLITAIQFMGSAMMNRPYMGTGRNLAYRKALFLDSKGFNKHLLVMGGDDDLFVNQQATRSNTAVSVGAASLVRSIPKSSWRSFLHQKLRHLSVGKHYRFRDKFQLGLFASTWILSWAIVPLMVQPQVTTTFLWAGFLFREILLMVLVHRASRTMGDAFETWKTPLLDFNYAIYYLGTGLVAMVSKRIRWKI